MDEEEELSIRHDLANTPFEELLQMRDKLGTKVYRETVLTKLASKEDAEEEDESMKSEKQVKSRRRVKNFERENRARPIEATSKRLDTRYNFSIRPEVDRRKVKGHDGPRDPRFDPHIGQFRERHFEQNYAFISDLKRQELDELRQQLKKAKNEQSRERLRFVIRRLENQIRTDREKSAKRQLAGKVREKVASVKNLAAQVVDTPKDGGVARKRRKPIFVNKATMKRAELAEKYQQLKQSGKLDKYLEKKRKKNAAKDRRKLAI